MIALARSRKRDVPRVLDRALIGLLILVVLVLLGMEAVMAGGPPTP